MATTSKIQPDVRQAFTDIITTLRENRGGGSVPILDEEGRVTGRTYDPRLGTRSGQPSPVRLMEHLDFMSEQQGFTPTEGETIPDFQLADPYRSETAGEYISNTLKLASNESLVGLGFEALTGGTIFDLEGFEPTRVESIAGGVLSFINPVDLGVMALGGGVASLAVKGLAKKALTKALIKKAGKSRGRQMYQKYVRALDTNTPIKVAFNEADRVILKTAQKAVSKELMQAIPRSAGALGAHGGVGDLFRGKIENDEWSIEDFYEGAVKSGVLGGLLGAVGGSAFRLTTELGPKIQRSIEISAEILTLGTASPYIFEGRTPTLDDYTDAAGFILGLRLAQGIPKMARTAYNVVNRKQSSRVALKEEVTKHEKVLEKIRKDKSTSAKAKESAVKEESVRYKTVVKEIQDKLNPLEAETKKMAALLRLETKKGEAEGKDFNDAIHEQILAASLSKPGDFSSDKALRTIRFTEKRPEDFQAQSLVDMLKAQVAARKKDRPKLPKGVTVLEVPDGSRAVLHSFEIATKTGKKLVFRLKELTSMSALSKVFDVSRETKQAIYLDPKLEKNTELFKLLKDTGLVGTKRFNGKYLKITIPKKLTRVEFRSQIEKNMPQLKTAEVDGIMAIAIARAESAGLKLDDWLQTRFFERVVIKGKLEKATKASIEFLDDGRAVIKAFKKSDVSSLVHEIGHVFRRDLSSSGRKEDIRIMEKFAGVGKNGIWTIGAEEKIARAFERYLADGKAPSAELKNVFKRFQDWLKKIYINIKDSGIGEEVSPEMKKVFGRLLTVDKRLKDIKIEPGSVIEGRAFLLSEYAGVTVKEAVKTEADLAGRPDMIKLAKSSGLDLGAYKAEELMLVTRSKEVAKSQGILDDFKLPKGSRVLAADGRGAFLVLTNPVPKILLQSIGENLRQAMSKRVGAVNKKSVQRALFQETEKAKQIVKSADLLFGSAELREAARKIWNRIPESIRDRAKSLQPEFAFRSRNRAKQKDSHDVITLTEKAHQVTSEMHTALLDEISGFGLHLIKDKKIAEGLGKRIEAKAAPQYNQFFEKLRIGLNRLLPKKKQIPKIEGYFPRTLKREIRELFDGEIKEMRKRLKDIEISVKGKKKKDATRRVAKALLSTDAKFKKAITDLLESGQAKSLREALKLLDRDVQAGLFVNPWFTKKRKHRLSAEFYETDARIVIPMYIEAYSKYYAEVLVFGPKREKILNLLKKIESKDPDEYRMMLKLVSMWSGLYDLNHGYTGKVKKGVDAFTALEVSTKIAMGFGTLLNTTQWVISFMPVVGVYESIGAGVRIFDAKYRAGLRGIGVVDNFEIQAIRATVGYDIGSGFGANRLSNFTTKWSGFQAINRLNLYWAASALDGVLPKWHRQAQGSGKRADIMKLRLQEDFGIDWKKPLELQEANRRNAIFQFATKSQLQRSVFEEPMFFGETKLKPLFLFKRFGWRQANLIKDMIQKEVFQRGNYMPIVRLAAGGFLGGTAMIWAQDMIRTLLSGEEAYREEDVWWNEWIERVASIGAFGMVSDMMAIDRLTDISGVFSFAAKPVILSDIEGIGKAFNRIVKDWENYGDGWLALGRNADQIFTFGGTLGSLPKALSKRLLTDPQIKNRTRFRKAQEKKEIFRFILEGNGDIASKRIAQWNKAFPDFAFGMHEINPGALLKFLLQRGEKRARAREVEGTPAFRQEKIKERRKAIKEFHEIRQREAS